MSAADAAQVGTGLAFVVMPLVFIFAFATHPGLLHPRMLGPEQLIDRARGDRRLHTGHALVTVNTALMIVVALHLGRIVTDRGAGWPALIGTVLAVLGTVALTADKGALCLTMSALDGLSDDEFAAARPALSAIFAKKGWLWMLWGIVLIPIGFAVLAIAALTSGACSPLVAVLLLVGVLFIGFPDGAEIVNLGAALTMATGLVPYGLTLIMASDRVRHCASMDGNAIWYSVRLGLEEGRTRDAVDRLIGWHRSDGSLIVPDWTGRPGPDRIHYPIQFFDVLFALQVMADLGRLGEPRCSDALEVSRGSYAGWGPSGLRRCNPLVTLAALAVLRAQTAGQQAGSEG